MYLVTRAEKRGHETKLILYGVYESVADAEARCRAVADALASEWGSDSWPAAVVYHGGRMIASIRYGMDGHGYVRVTEVDANADIEKSYVTHT